jgi:hypothetical protein
MSLTLNKVAPCIFVYENAIADGARFIEMLEEETENEWSSLQWDFSRTGSGRISEYRSSRLCSLVDITRPCRESEISKLFNESILKNVHSCISDYAIYHGIPPEMNGEGWIVLKYEGEAQYRTHWDHSGDNGRMISVVAFPYSTATVGGELHFPHFNTTVKPQTGSVVVFPSNFPYTHTAHPVENGIKYSLVTWLR